MDNRVVKVKIATDKEFKAHYWSFSPSEVNTAVASALQMFRERFPQITFALDAKPLRWNSFDAPLVRDFPFSLIVDLPRKRSFADLVEIMAERAEQMGFSDQSRVRNPEALHRIIASNKKRSKAARFWYLMGFLDGAFAEELLLDLERKVPSQDNEMVLGFSGKLFLMERELGGCMGVARHGGNHAVFPVQYKRKLHLVALHEIGHLFGAEHPEKNVKSIMDAHLGEDTVEFDADNVERIEARIAAM